MVKKIIISFLLIFTLGAGCLSCAAPEEELIEVVSVNDDDSPQETSTETEVEISQTLSEEVDLQKDSPETENDRQETASEETPAKQEEPAEQKDEISYIVDRWDETKTMYVITSVNVRKGPDTAYEVCGHLATANPITVLGTADTGWYLIMYQDEESFVSNRYVQDTPPTPAPEEQVSDDAAPTSAPQNQTASGETQPAPVQTPAPTAEPPKAVASTIFVGDSRFVQMHAAVGDNGVTWICEGGKGYPWFEEKAIPRIDNLVGKGTKILINLGVNDTHHADSYVTLVNGKAAEWTQKGATVYYASVNPVWENPYVTNDQVVAFNAKLSANLTGIIWIDSYTYLTENGYRLVDGLHYAEETYSAIYSYFMANIQ